MHRKPKKAKFSSVSADRAAESDKDILKKSINREALRKNKLWGSQG